MKKPYYIKWNECSVIAVAGKAGTGKTHTARYLCNQCIDKGYTVIICDPHGYKDESLAQSFDHVHITKQERLRAIRVVFNEFKKRIAGSSTDQKIILVIDEITAHFLECEPEEKKECANFLLRLANEARKVNIRVFLMGHNWKDDMIGLRDIRSSITHVIFHRLDENETKLFIPSANAKIRRTIGALPIGHVYIYPDDKIVRIPE